MFLMLMNQPISLPHLQELKIISKTIVFFLN